MVFGPRRVITLGLQRSAQMLFQLDRESKKPLYEQLSDQVRELIVSGQLKEGYKMPSVRGLSEELCISHTTAERFYMQLVAEGYLANVPRSGYVVESVDTSYFDHEPDDTVEEVRAILAARDADALRQENTAGMRALYDFSFANLRPGSFPSEVWRKLTADILYSKSADELTCYPSADYLDPLCVQLAEYLSNARGAKCVPEQIVVANATQHALTDLLILFSRDLHTIGMEEPGYCGAHDVFRRLGFRALPLPTDQGTEAFIGAVKESCPKLVFTTPSHQFPTGKVLPLEARVELLAWAHENNAYIIEDDACHEFRYATRPIPSLYSLDRHNRVVYLGTFSKALSPQVRVSYLVLPPKLLSRYHRVFHNMHPSVPWLTVKTLALFMERGHWDRQVRRQVALNRKAHNALVKALSENMGDHISVSGVDAGMHLYVQVHNGMTQRELLESARAQGANVYSTQRYWFSKKSPEDCVIIGFSAIRPDEIGPGVVALRQAWFPAKDGA